MPQNFKEDSKPRLACYNAFLTQYKTVDQLTEDVDRIADLGFNAIWLGPFADTTNTVTDPITERARKRFVKTSTAYPLEVQLRRSLYAGSGKYHLLEQAFLSPKDKSRCKDENEWAELTEKKIGSFTQACKRRGIIPVADLVLGHIHSDSPILDELKSRGIVVTGHQESATTSFRDTVSLNYGDLSKKEVLRKHWEGVIDIYMDKFGFEGFRVDNVAGIPSWIREHLYQYIRGKQKDSLIIDELLFSKEDINSAVQKASTAKPTHVMGSAIWVLSETQDRSDDVGRMNVVSNILKSETGLKSIMIRKNEQTKNDRIANGVVESTGNHDFVNLHQSVIEKVCFDWMYKTKKFNDRTEIKEIADLLEVYRNMPVSERRGSSKIYIVLALKLVSMYCERVVEDPVLLEKFCYDFLQEYKRRVAVASFAGTGGYYMMKGDEICELQENTYIAVPMPGNEKAETRPLLDKTSAAKVLKGFLKGFSLSDALLKKGISMDLLPKESAKITIGAAAQMASHKTRELKKSGVSDQKTKALNQFISLLSSEKKILEESLSKEIAEYSTEAEHMRETQHLLLSLMDKHFQLKEKTADWVRNCNSLLADMGQAKDMAWTEIIELNGGLVCFIESQGFGLSELEKPKITLVNIAEKNIEIDDSVVHDLCMQFEQQNGGHFGSGHYSYVRRGFDDIVSMIQPSSGGLSYLAHRNHGGSTLTHRSRSRSKTAPGVLHTFLPPLVPYLETLTNEPTESANEPSSQTRTSPRSRFPSGGGGVHSSTYLVYPPDSNQGLCNTADPLASSELAPLTDRGNLRSPESPLPPRYPSPASSVGHTADVSHLEASGGATFRHSRSKIRAHALQSENRKDDLPVAGQSLEIVRLREEIRSRRARFEHLREQESTIKEEISRLKANRGSGSNSWERKARLKDLKKKLPAIQIDLHKISNVLSRDREQLKVMLLRLEEGSGSKASVSEYPDHNLNRDPHVTDVGKKSGGMGSFFRILGSASEEMNAERSRIQLESQVKHQSHAEYMSQRAYSGTVGTTRTAPQNVGAVFAATSLALKQSKSESVDYSVAQEKTSETPEVPPSLAEPDSASVSSWGSTQEVFAPIEPDRISMSSVDALPLEVRRSIANFPFGGTSIATEMSRADPTHNPRDRKPSSYGGKSHSLRY